MDRVGDIIGKRLNQHHLGESARAASILRKANLFLQNRLRCTEDEVNAFRIKDGVLYVSAVGSAWGQEVFHHKAVLMREVKKEYGERSILKIVIKSLTSTLN